MFDFTISIIEMIKMITTKQMKKIEKMFEDGLIEFKTYKEIVRAYLEQKGVMNEMG